MELRQIKVGLRKTLNSTKKWNSETSKLNSKKELELRKIIMNIEKTKIAFLKMVFVKIHYLVTKKIGRA